MMASRLLLNSTLPYGITIQRCGMSGLTTGPAVKAMYDLKIGTREVVGFGFNGEPSYIDRFDRPMPAIRFKEETPEIKALREKEKGDWKKLSLEEKKQLYRASFCQTLEELDAPTGEWKHALGVALLFCSLGLWTYMFLKNFVYHKLPITFSEEHKRAQLIRMKKLQINPIRGISSQP